MISFGSSGSQTVKPAWWGRQALCGWWWCTVDLYFVELSSLLDIWRRACQKKFGNQSLELCLHRAHFRPFLHTFVPHMSDRRVAHRLITPGIKWNSIYRSVFSCFKSIFIHSALTVAVIVSNKALKASKMTSKAILYTHRALCRCSFMLCSSKQTKRIINVIISTWNDSQIIPENIFFQP